MKWSGWIAVLMIAGCAAEELPADFEPGADCIRVTIQPIPPEEDDPHDGEKHVYYCGTPQEELWGDSGPVLPVPDGTTVLKTSRKLNQEHDWLIARAEKQNGSWVWSEFTRNFADEPYVEIPFDEQVCTDCHADAQSSDWMFTVFTPPPPPAN